MHPVEILRRLGGVAGRAQILRLSDRATLDRLVRSGDILRDARGRYSLPETEASVRLAGEVNGVLSHLSAALHHGWEVKDPTGPAHLTFRRGRRLATGTHARCVPHWADLPSDDVVDGLVTSRERTLADVLRAAAFDEALCVADSALRHEAVTPAGLVRIADAVTGPGARQARRVARLADGRAANPFESVVRALSEDVRRLRLVPQLEISGPGFFARPDLVDVELRIVVEADSHTWHSSRKALRRDCRRYNQLLLAGWIVMRFTWEDVMFDPDYVREVLQQVALLAVGRPQSHVRRPKAA